MRRAAVFLVLLAGCPSPHGTTKQPPPAVPVACPAPLAAVDVSDAVVVQECTESALTTALASSPAKVKLACAGTISLTATIHVTSDLVLDGGGTATLDGGGNVRIISIDSSFEKDTPHVVVQNLGFAHGKASGTDLNGGGAAIARVGGTLDVIDCSFDANAGNVDGQDTQGGAVFSEGGKATTIVGSTFTGNTCSDGGALGTLNSNLVVVNSSFDGNSATGTGGNPGDGGNGGSIYVDAQDRDVTLCGVKVTNSKANAFGGGVFRMAYSFTEKTDIANSSFTASIDDHDPSQGGGLYLQGTVATLDAVTVSSSTASTAGGAYFGPGATVNMTNVSFLDDVASSGLGGGVFIDGVKGGALLNCSFIGNQAPGSLAFGGAVVGNASNVTMTNSLVLDSAAGNGFNPISCTTTMLDGAGSFQFPVTRTGGGSDQPGSLCAPNIAVADVPVADVDTSGIVPVRAPKPGTLAIGAGKSCPPTDALGHARSTTSCTSGAVEVAVKGP